jgi:hypothetical protein
LIWFEAHPAAAGVDASDHRASDDPCKDENADLDYEEDASDGNRKKHFVGGQEKHGSPRLWTSPQRKIDRKWSHS